ncbi:1-acyl-sn-glycerol-3-phosphate acyltransferase [Williamwhitmania taraxaci]|uniref:Acyltransferase n=1 Tax=Williamwhitmania taraxaci TaxID=1640674 RepID=A0A1G6H9D2_9BACT|nr:1-acyl-sn-glycerol-3-phosphate acyltransferase [Williamwhitmania taraxaci]SDB90897.1 Acyltransferase [Williamwhitmania taraxaci]
MTETLNKKHLNVGELLKKSDSKNLRQLPGFVVKVIEKIICQDQMNYVINKYIDYVGVNFQPQVIKEFGITLNVRGIENLPNNSRCFFASNHPFGIIDGLVLTYYVGQKYGDLKAIGNDAFMHVPTLKPLIAAVNVYGRSSKEYIKALDEVYESNVAITHFPAGEVSRVYNGIIQDAPWQKSFITKAVSSKRDIVPFYFDGVNSSFFYLVFRLRHKLGISANLELILLPREMFKKRNKTISLVIGKPIPWQTFDSSMTHYEWAQKVRQHVYKLGHSIDQVNFN